MDKKQRLTGIDLFRGIAAYAVVVIHTEHGASIDTSWANQLVQFSGFAVPFFLATSFYLIINSLYVKGTQYPLKSRLIRLLIPYGIWSTVYILQNVFKHLILNKSGELNYIFQDPVQLIFFGGAAYHLYFLPLLFTGTIFIKFVEHLVNKKIKVYRIVILLLLSIITYHLMVISENTFQLANSTAFQGLLNIILPNGNQNFLLRFTLVELSWIVRCLPYIFIAMLLNHPSIRKYLVGFNSSYTISLFFIFLFINIFGNLFLTEAVYEIARGYITLLLAISLSFILKENFITKNISVCSFGIYLVHLLLVHVFQSITKKIYPGSETMVVTLIPLLILSTISFLSSWIIVSFILRKKVISKLMFGG